MFRSPAARAARRALPARAATLAALLLTLFVAAPTARAERSTLDSGAAQTCAVRDGGGVSCWGDYVSPYYPRPTPVPTNPPYPATEFTPPVPTDVPAAAPASSVAAGDQAYQCAVRADATVGCWGWGSYFDADYWPRYRIAPVQITVQDFPSTDPLTNIVDVAVNDREACGLRSDGTVWCWRAPLGRARQIAGLGDATSITAESTPYSPSVNANGAAFCARRQSGAVACWDRGFSRGQSMFPGPDTPWVDGAVPADVPGIADAVSVSGRCALLATGRVACWSITHRPQKNEEYIAFSAPAEVPGIGSAVDLSSRDDHSCVVRADGTVACWGNNAFGQLGETDIPSPSEPVVVPGISTATDVSVGDGVTCARLSDASVRCWGKGTLLGNPDAAAGFTPTPVRPAGELAVAPSTDLRPGDPTPSPFPPTPTPVPPTLTPTPQPPTPTPEPATRWDYAAAGRASLRTLTSGTVAIGGTTRGSIAAATGVLNGNVTLRDAPAKLQALRLLPITATIGFTEIGTTTGQLTGTALSVTTRQALRIKNVKLFGVSLVSNACVTSKPSVIALKSTTAGFTPAAGGTLIGTFTIAPLSSCGSLGAVVSGLTAGSGNGVALTLTP